ncbi:DUF2178 domain-containing protein [Aquimarina spongiae]|uniref:Predicted membrane protein n=1 Tax=Aquimarina spongiae TaxID=570521 RepID=A0A1M6I0W5_9FLAO|nr:DUF2178 domain-containing protein [Aquimarina spongiae]SHJ28045.1 Predicted membrane protein [Aquimarina spongiae]
MLEILNFVLEINNIINAIKMKIGYKTLISFMGTILGFVLLVLWLYMAKKPFNATGYLIFGLSFIMILIGVYFKIQTYKNQRLGLTSEDEFSKRIKERASSKAFSISFYIWLGIILFVKDIEPKAKIIMGLGLLVMALVFLLNWLYYSKVGISDENED